VAQRHGPTVHVHLVAVEVEVADELLGHHGERLVDLEQVDVVEGEAGLGQHLAGGRHRRVEHERGVVAHVGDGHDARTRLPAASLGGVGAGDEDGGSAVDHARAVAGVVHVRDLEVGVAGQHEALQRGALLVEREVGHAGERRCQLREALERGLRAGELLAVKREGAVLLVDGHEALGKATFGDSASSTLLRLERERIERLARDALHRGDGIGRHTLMGLRVLRTEPHVAGIHQRAAHVLLGGAERRVQRHHLAAAGDDHVLHARHHVGRGKVGGGDARTAETVEGDTRGLRVVAGVEQRHAGEVAALGAHLIGRAEDDVVDGGGVEIVAVADGAEHRGGQLLRVDVGKGTLADLADATGGAAGVDDPGFGHGRSPQKRPRGPVERATANRLLTPIREATIVIGGASPPISSQQLSSSGSTDA
jgi:hypothetical protein